ncbi:class I SAM-dependent methyltransferase [Blastococcus sp. SYSU D00813]
MELAHVRGIARRTEDAAQRVLAGAGLRHSERRICADAQAYWQQPGDPGWQSDAHWRTESAFAGNDLWPEIGRRHLTMFERGTRTVRFDRPWGRVLEWGCGGGANAVHFAPRADEFIGVDVSAETLSRCGSEVAAVSDTPWRPVRIAVDDPEAALDEVDRCDVWLSFYVFELIPSPEYGERLLRIAHRMLTPGGLALIQVKYSDGRWLTRPRRRSYRSGLASMTTYGIDEFWRLAQRCGFVPETVELVPQDALDERYAYYLLTRPADGG